MHHLDKAPNALVRLSMLLLLTLSLSLTTLPSYAEAEQPPTIDKEQVLHTALVLSALKADFFSARCRGISVAKYFNKVNRLFITKYSLTANNYIKTYINADVRKEKGKQEITFKKALNMVGGCSKAKNADWKKIINNEFNSLFEQAEQSTWFPEEN